MAFRNLNPQDETVKNYDVGDGLQSVEFNQGTAYRLPSGEMFFGGIKGFNAFFPDEIQESSFIPPVVLTDFLLFNTPVKPGSSDILPQAIGQSQEIHLDYDQNFITFEFDRAGLRRSA